MSEDEDCFNGGGALVLGKFISRALVYRTQILNDFYTNLDKIADPRPSTKYIPRVRGDPKDVPPPSSTLLKNKARRWMVRSEWIVLDDNKDFDVPSRIMDSGRLWGDSVDPEEVEGKQKRVKEEKQELKRKKIKLEDIAERKKKKKVVRKQSSTVRGQGKGTKNTAGPSRARDEDEMSTTTNEDT